MNQFANLSAESEVSALAQVSAAEVFTADAAPEVAPRYGVNVAKLVRHNLRVPMARRIERAELAAKVAFARARGNIVGLWATIHAECEAERATLRARDEALATM